MPVSIVEERYKVIKDGNKEREAKIVGTFRVVLFTACIVLL